MSVREFRDASGRRWRAWDIDPDEIHPQTKAEDYLADCFQSGWIVFETFDGSDRRRLCPTPGGWAAFGEEELRSLLARADRIPLSKVARGRSPMGTTPKSLATWNRRAEDRAVSPPDRAVDATDLRVVRSFHYPGGRVWAASLIPNPDGSDSHVLRFSSGFRHLDLERWPRDWPDYGDDRLVELLRSAAPRESGGAPPSGVAGRRRDDPRP